MDANEPVQFRTVGPGSPRTDDARMSIFRLSYCVEDPGHLFGSQLEASGNLQRKRCTAEIVREIVQLFSALWRIQFLMLL